jgi:hypothetical protein
MSAGLLGGDGGSLIDTAKDSISMASDAKEWVTKNMSTVKDAGVVAAAVIGGTIMTASSYALIKAAGGTNEQAAAGSAFASTPIGSTITAALSGYNVVKNWLDGDETKGNHGRRLADEYSGSGTGPIAWTNWQILEADGNESGDHHRSGAIEVVDKVMKSAIDADLPLSEAMPYVELQVRAQLTERYKDATGWSPELINKYSKAATDALFGVAENNEDILKF